MKIISVYAAVCLLQTQHWGRGSATTTTVQVLGDQIQRPLTNKMDYMDPYTPVVTMMSPLLMFPRNNKRLLAVQGRGHGGGLAADATGALHKERFEGLSRRGRTTTDSPMKKSKNRRGKGKHHHSKENRRHHSRERYYGRRSKKPKHKKRGSRERSDGEAPPPDWTSWIHHRQPSDPPPRGYGNPHIPAFVPHGSGIPSFVPNNPVPPYAPSLPGHFPRNPYYPSYIPVFGPGVPYHPGWGEPPHHHPTLGTTTSTTRRPLRRTRRPKPPRKTTPHWFTPHTTYPPKPLTEATVTWPTFPYSADSTPTQVPDLVSMSTYISEVFTATVPVIATFANGEPITANTDAETIPPLVRISRSDELKKWKW